MRENGAKKYEFDTFLLDVTERRLTRGGETVALSSRAFDLLTALVENSGRLVRKEDLYKRVWSDAIVEDANLSVQIAAIRKALGAEYIDTVKGHGYRFKGDIRPLNGSPAYLLESKGFSRITIEHETNNAVGSSSVFKNKRVIYGFACVAVAAVFGFVVYTWLSGTSPDSVAAVSGFQTGSIKRLTSTGRVGRAAAISPDGKLFAYSQFDGERQSLWVAHVGGGEPLQVRPPAEANYRSVRFAPDGGGLLFTVSDSGLYRMPVFGGPAELIDERVRQGVSFSPDGNRFAFIRPAPAGEGGVVIASIERDEEKTLGIPPTGLGFVTHSPAWSPDGSTIIVAAPINESGTRVEIFALDINTGTISQITSANWSEVDTVSWTADGQGLIAAVGGRLWHVAYPNGDSRPLTNDLGIYTSAVGLSASGTELLTVQVQQFSNVWTAPADDLKQAHQVTFGSLGRAEGWSGLDWTLDGRIIYTAVIGSNQTIWRMNADGTGQEQLTTNTQRNFHPSVSDDGRTLVYVSSQDGRYTVWRANADGTGLSQLTYSDIAAQPHISPDGKWVVYISNINSFGTLYRIPAEGGEPVQLTANKMCWVRVSPDSRLVAGAYQIGGETKLAIISIDGGSPLRIFDVPRLANFRLGVRWTPDGNAVTYRDWTNGIWKQSIGGGEPERLAGLPEEKLYAYAWSRDGGQFAYARGREIRDVVLLSKLN